MPYIKSEDRSKYDVVIQGVMALIPLNESAMVQAVKVACFADYLIQALKRVGNPSWPYVHHYSTRTGTEVKFREYAEELARILPGNPESRAGDLNYSLSLLTWGLCGDDPSRTQARYCMRSFIKGALWRALLVNTNDFNGEEYIFFTGVFTDVIDEMYRRKTIPFETEKMLANGDLYGS